MPVVLDAVALCIDARRAEVQAVSAGSSTISSSRPPAAEVVTLEGTRIEVAGVEKGKWEGF